MASESVREINTSALVRIHHVAALQGVIFDFESWVIVFAITKFHSLLFGLIILVHLLSRGVWSGQRVNVRGESHVKSVALLAHDVVIFAAVALLLLSHSYVVESAWWPWKSRYGGGVISLTTPRLTNLVLGLLLIFVDFKVIFVGPKSVSHAGFACSSERGGWFYEIGWILRFQLFRGVNVLTCADSRWWSLVNIGSRCHAPFLLHSLLRSRFGLKNRIHWSAFLVVLMRFMTPHFSLCNTVHRLLKSTLSPSEISRCLGCSRPSIQRSCGSFRFQRIKFVVNIVNLASFFSYFRQLTPELSRLFLGTSLIQIWGCFYIFRLSVLETRLEIAARLLHTLRNGH